MPGRRQRYLSYSSFQITKYDLPLTTMFSKSCSSASLRRYLSLVFRRFPSTMSLRVCSGASLRHVTCERSSCSRRDTCRKVISILFLRYRMTYTIWHCARRHCGSRYMFDVDAVVEGRSAKGDAFEMTRSHRFLTIAYVHSKSESHFCSRVAFLFTPCIAILLMITGSSNESTNSLELCYRTR